jgi:hypothetical protein
MKIGRNDPCPCGSGKKYKKCCISNFQNSDNNKAPNQNHKTIQELEQIEYRYGMLERGMKPDTFPVIKWRGTKIPSEVRESINEEEILNLGGIYGDKTAGDPIEYDHLRLVLTGGTVEIIVYNRGISLMMSDDKRIRCIHRVLCKLRKT